jgi:opacity protein-like surface antigen
MKKLSVSMAAALALGLLVAPAAEATTDPVYDPGSKIPSRFTLMRSAPGGTVVAAGAFVEYSVSFSERSYVKDTVDDGLDVYVWVQYGKQQDYVYQEPMGSVSGFNVSKSFTWASPAGMHVDFVLLRLCLGPGEGNCSKWTS